MNADTELRLNKGVLVITTVKLAGVEDSQWERHKVILAAAVAAVTGGRARIREIREAPARDSSAWTARGRLAIQASHELGPPLARVLPRGASQ